MKKVDVIIPVYKPDKRLFVLLDRLMAQTYEVNQIFLINTEQQYFDALVKGADLTEKYDRIKVRHISALEFDHGNTRREAVRESNAEYFIMMTDDALPADEFLVERLLQPLLDNTASMSYARQLPAEGCRTIETYTRSFNYPEQSALHSAEDIPTLGIKAFFASNVCAAYDRAVYEKLGGFTEKTIFNEDMIFARGLIDAGHAIAYQADARVFHSHNYGGLMQFRRNFDLGVSHAEYPEIFGDVKAEGEGIRLVEQTSAYLCRIKKPWLVLLLIWQSGCKFLGYRLGRHYRRLPGWLIPVLSMNRSYWKK